MQTKLNFECISYGGYGDYDDSEVWDSLIIRLPGITLLSYQHYLDMKGLRPERDRRLINLTLSTGVTITGITPPIRVKSK